MSPLGNIGDYPAKIHAIRAVVAAFVAVALATLRSGFPSRPPTSCSR